MNNVLYHYTCKIHFPQILTVGFLKLTESNLRADQEFYKPVVWMTTLDEPEPRDIGQDGCAVDKTEIRIHIKKKKSFQFWRRFSRDNKINRQWAKRLEKGRKSNTWWISTEIITLDDILLIENRYTGEVYFKQTDGKVEELKILNNGGDM